MAKTVKVIELLAESDHSWEDAATARRVINESAQRFVDQPA